MVALSPGAWGDITLAQKAAVFDADLQERFTLEGQVLCKLKLPNPQRSFVAYNMPDNAYMTGMYLGALAFRYAATGDAAVQDQGKEALAAMNILCTASGKPGLLARAFWPVGKPFDDDGTWRESADGRYRWRGDVSSDQIDGVMFGYDLAYEFLADDEAKKTIARNVTAIADHVLRNGLRIVGFDGNPTRWGKYYPEYVQKVEPMNALLFLQLLKVAAYVTGEDRFETLYREYALDKGYAETTLKARNLRDPIAVVNHSDDVLIYLAYYPLLRHEQDPALRDLYLRGLRRTWGGNVNWPGVKPEENPLYDFITREFLGDGIDVAPGLRTLERFPLDMKWNGNTIAAYEKRFAFTFQAEPRSEEALEGLPVPMDRRVKSWSAWVMNPYTKAGTRTADQSIEYNGHDYLLAYWLGRRLKIIDGDR